VAETALAIAREKAADRWIEVEFAAADAFQLERLGRRFETVLDCGLFHTSTATSDQDTIRIKGNKTAKQSVLAHLRSGGEIARIVKRTTKSKRTCTRAERGLRSRGMA
jgi:hypothetical protein